MAELARLQGQERCARWLERSVGWQPIHHACDDRRGAQHLVALLRGGVDGACASVAGETPEEICALADPAQGARTEDPAMTKLVPLIC